MQSHADGMSLSMQDLSLEETFDSYCIVCDRLIVPPKEKEVAPKPKKKPAGAIRVSQGSTTWWPRLAMTGVDTCDRSRTLMGPRRRAPRTAPRRPGPL